MQQNPFQADLQEPVAQPVKIRVEQISGGIKITRRWTIEFTDMMILTASVVMIVIAIKIFSSKTSNMGSGGLTGLLLWIGGLILLYRSLFAMFNSTRIWLILRKMVVTKGPIPWLPMLVFPADEIVSFSYHETTHMSRRRKYFTYSLQVALKDGSMIEIDDCATRDEAAFLSRELQKHLQSMTR